MKKIRKKLYWPVFIFNVCGSIFMLLVIMASYLAMWHYSQYGTLEINNRTNDDTAFMSFGIILAVFVIFYYFLELIKLEFNITRKEDGMIRKLVRKKNL